MNTLESYARSYRAHFRLVNKQENYKFHAINLLRTLLLGFVMVIILLIVGFITDTLKSFTYIFLATQIILLITSYTYAYINHHANRDEETILSLEKVVFYPWMKWVSTLFTYESLLLFFFLQDLVPMLIILVTAIISIITLIYIMVFESYAELKNNPLFSIAVTSLLLLIGHLSLLYLLPISNPVLAYLTSLFILILMMIGKQLLQRLDHTYNGWYRESFIGIFYFMGFLLVFFVTSLLIPNRDQNIELFNSGSVIREMIKVENDLNHFEHPIESVIYKDSYLYVMTTNRLYILDERFNTITYIDHVLGMKITDSNQGVLLIETSIDEDTSSNTDNMNVYAITDTFDIELLYTSFIPEWIDIKYIHIIDDRIIYFDYLESRIQYFDGTTYNDSSTVEDLVIEEDDIYIEFRDGIKFGLHKTYGPFTNYFMVFPTGAILDRFSFIENEKAFYYAGYSNHQFFYHLNPMFDSAYYYDFNDTTPFLIMKERRHKAYLSGPNTVFILQNSMLTKYQKEDNPNKSAYTSHTNLIMGDNGFYAYSRNSTSIDYILFDDYSESQKIVYKNIDDYIWILSLLTLFVLWSEYTIDPSKLSKTKKWFEFAIFHKE